MIPARLELYCEFLNKKVEITLFDGEKCVGTFLSFNEHNDVTLIDSYCGDRKIEYIQTIFCNRMVSLKVYGDPDNKKVLFY